MNDGVITRRRGLAGITSCVALVAAGRSFQGNAVPVNSGRQLIISSDDAGMCRSVNEGTIVGLQRGQITSASIMTCCPAFDEFADFAIRHPEFDYGIHLVLTCDLRGNPWGPVLGEHRASSLVGSDGSFPIWPAENVRIDEVERELRAQIEKALNAGIRITHFDHHMWVMFHSPNTIRLYARLGLEYGVPVRFSRDIPTQVSRRGPEFVTAYKQQLHILQKQNMPIMEFVDAGNYLVPTREKRSYYVQALRHLPVGISEIAAHCALRSLNGSAVPPDFEGRCADTAFWTSLEAVDALANENIHRVTWSDVS